MGASASSKAFGPRVFKLVPFIAICIVASLTGCANQSQVRTASSGGIDPKYGVRASPRVVADGEAVPKGGGNSMVGKPYTIAGKTYYPSERSYAAVGLASWYGSDFHGRRTANGEVFDRMSISAAHPTMPLPSYARVTNLRNQHSIIVRVNDRGPYHANRVMDVSEQVAEALEFRRAGTARVKVEYVSRAALTGSDDRKLLATLRTDGPGARFERDDANYAVAQTSAPLATQTATVVSRSADEDDEQPAPRAMSAAPKLAAAPLPPLRPFDLGTIPGAGVPIAAPRMAAGSRSAPRTIQALLSDSPPPPLRR